MKSCYMESDMVSNEDFAGEQDVGGLGEGEPTFRRARLFLPPSLQAKVKSFTLTPSLSLSMIFMRTPHVLENLLSKI